MYLNATATPPVHFPPIKYLCISEYDPAMRLIAYVSNPVRIEFDIISTDLYPGNGASLRLTANSKQDNPQSENVILSAEDDLYDYYLPFPKSELAKPTLNYFFPQLTIKYVGTFQSRKAQLECAQQF